MLGMTVHVRQAAHVAIDASGNEPLCDALAKKKMGSRIPAFEVPDPSFEPEGVVLTILHSKTDREGAGATVAVPLREEATGPVGELRRWLETAAIGEGRVFRRIDRHGSLGSALSDGASRDRGGYIRLGCGWDDNPAADLTL